jgi:hypothetical protein
MSGLYPGEYKALSRLIRLTIANYFEKKTGADAKKKGCISD